MAVTVASFHASGVATEFAAAASGTVQAALDFAEATTNRDQWGDARADRAVILLAAHELKLNAAGAGADPGPVTSRGAGPLSVSFAGPRDSDDRGLGSTAYGRRYQSLLRGVFAERFP